MHNLHPVANCAHEHGLRNTHIFFEKKKINTEYEGHPISSENDLIK